MLVDQDQFINRMGPYTNPTRVKQSCTDSSTADQSRPESSTVDEVEQLQGYLEAELHQIYQSNYVAN